MYRRSSESGTWWDRSMRLLTEPSGRVRLGMITTYLAAALGLFVAFFGGIDNPNSDLATLGILLLFVSFVSLFYVSVTVLTLEQDG